MTVSAQTPINRSTGNGVTTVFPYTFKIIADADIEVTVDDVVKTLNVDYTVSGAGVDAGGNVTMTVAPANATSVVRRRNMALVRSTDYQDQGELPATTLDNDIDATVLMVQQLDERLDRTFSLPASFSGDSTLPAPEPGYLIGWDATGENLTNIPASVGNSLVDLSAPSGSSLVGYLPAGTGAVATNVQTKLRESVSVKDFGAVGDGVTDDTVAIQKAIDYCTNLSNRKQTLYFPAPNAATFYKITAPLVIKGRLNIVGDGAFSTVIMAVGFTSGQYVLDFDNLAGDVVYYGGVSNITLRCDNSLAVGIRLNNISYVLVKNVQLHGLQKGIYITGTACFSNFFEEVTGYAITAYTVHMDAFTGGGQYMFSGCTFTGSDGFVLSSTAATDSLTFFNCNFEQCITDDIYIAGSVSGLTIQGCRSEGLNGANSFFIEPAVGKVVSGVSISGCSWQTDSGNAYAVTLSGAGIVKGFSITGNYAGYIGFLAFVNLNGQGEGGIIAGNYCVNTPAAKIVNVPRKGVSCFANENTAGPMYDYGGNAGTFTATGTGFTVAPTATFGYSQNGKTVTIDLGISGSISGTSNATSFTITGMPQALWPASDKDFFTKIIDNGTAAMGIVRVKPTGVIEIYATLTGGMFTAAGTKQLPPTSLTYTL